LSRTRRLEQARSHLVIVPGFLSNIDFGWQFESWRNYYGALASFARVLLLDKRGTEISDPVSGAPSFEERMDDVRAVMDTAGSERAAPLGSADGAALAALFAATYPNRTAALILNNPVVRGGWAPDYPWGSRGEPDSAAFFADGWGSREAIEEAIAGDMPGRVGDEQFARLMESYTRLSASPTTFANLLGLNLAIDVRAALSTIRAPTLVTHVEGPERAGDHPSAAEELSSRRVEASRYVAERVPGARFVELAPGDPIVWAVDQSEALALFQEFLVGAWQAGAWEPAEPDRVLATLLFTDIVNSAERAAELGDARWRDVVQRHHALVRQELLRFRGREIDTAGDGFFASFDGPARAVRCAAPPRSWQQFPNLDSESERASTRVSARSSMASREAWPSLSERGSHRLLLLARSSRRARSRISSLGPGSHSRNVASTSLKACLAPGHCTLWSM
jgi:pimeloyl-ACP methyl ester carboxylesterase